MDTKSRERFLSIAHELEANAWLEAQLLERLETYEKTLSNPLDPDEYKASRGILKGRLPRPVLRHIYLLGFFPLTDEQLEAKAEQAGYGFPALHYHYRKNETAGNTAQGSIREFPQAFLEAFLVRTMEGDISKGSAHKLITLFASLGLVDRKACVTGNNSIAISIGAEFQSLVEQWLDRKNGVYTEKHETMAA